MQDVDVIILGNGPAALSVLDKYAGSVGNGKVILLNEKSLPRGSYSKGVKSVNPIVPKLPRIAENVMTYEHITRRVKAAEASLVKEYQRTHAYQGSSNIGLRYCKNGSEHDILCRISGLGQDYDSALDKVVGKFVTGSLGHDLANSKLFAFPEKIWNIRGYLALMQSKIPEKYIYNVDHVRFEGANSGVILSMEKGDGGIQLIRTQKLLVCMGMGNIYFEENVRSKTSSPAKLFSFEVLDLAKFLHESGNGIPANISSIMVPKHNVCLTNEEPNLYSVLYDTNAKLIPANEYNLLTDGDSLDSVTRKLIEMNPGIPQKPYDSFKCAMTVKQQAYTDNPDLHFQFLISGSAVDHIQYLNLPYFTVVQAATQTLPIKLIDLK